MKLTTLFSLSLVALSFIACSKKGDSSTVATAATTYYISNGLCYNNSNVQVDYTNCSNSTSTVYHVSGGLCYNASNVQVDYSLCSTTYYIANGMCYNSSNVQVNYSYCTGTTGTSCSGLYYYIDYYGQLWKVTCDGVANTGNCSGYDLIQSSTGNYTQCL